MVGGCFTGTPRDINMTTEKTSKYYYSPKYNGFCHSDITDITKLSGLIGISKDMHTELCMALSKGGQLTLDADGLPEVVSLTPPSEDNLKVIYCSVIEKFILNKIQAMPYDYDNVEQLNTWITHDEYGTEATVLKEWCINCQTIAFNIKSNIVRYNSPEEVIASLPPFPFNI